MFILYWGQRGFPRTSTVHHNKMIAMLHAYALMVCGCTVWMIEV